MSQDGQTSIFPDAPVEKKRKRQPRQANDESVSFSFGDPVPVMEGREILDYSEVWKNGDYYEPPFSISGLAKSFRASPHHSSAIYVKRNIIVSSYNPHPLLSKHSLSQLTLDYLVFGNAYIERITSRSNKIMELRVSPAKQTRSMGKGKYLFLKGWQKMHYFPQGSVLHLLQPDFNQEIYGSPEYLSALNSAWLNESATLFRRKYYQNGSHAGYILYLTDAAQKTSDVEKLKKALKESKGPGNFRNLFLYAPKGQKDGLQVIPLAEAQAKDEFLNIKNVTRDDVLAGHRIPPQLMGIVPTNAGGFGSAEVTAQVFNRNEIVPIQEMLKEINDWVGKEIVTFRPYEISTTTTDK